jgi:hypothetical protein
MNTGIIIRAADIERGAHPPITRVA